MNILIYQKGNWPPRATIKLSDEAESILLGDSNRILYQVTNVGSLRSSYAGTAASRSSVACKAAMNSAFLSNASISNMDSMGSGGGGGGGGGGSIPQAQEEEGSFHEKEYSVRELMKEKERREIEHLRGEVRNNSIISRSSLHDGSVESGSHFTMDTDERSRSQREADAVRDRKLSDSFARLKWRRVPLGPPAVSTMLLEQQRMSPPRPQFQQQYEDTFLKHETMEQQMLDEESGARGSGGGGRGEQNEFTNHYESYKAHLSHEKSFGSNNDESNVSRDNMSRDNVSYDSLNKTEKEIKKDTQQIYEVISGKNDKPFAPNNNNFINKKKREEEGDNDDNDDDAKSVDSNLSSESSLNPLTISTSFSFAKVDGHPQFHVSIQSEEEESRNSQTSSHHKKTSSSSSSSNNNGNNIDNSDSQKQKKTEKKKVNKTIKPENVINNILSERPRTRPGTTGSRKSVEDMDDYYIPCCIASCANEACFWSDGKLGLYIYIFFFFFQWLIFGSIKAC
jgi:hypothetical protein